MVLVCMKCEALSTPTTYILKTKNMSLPNQNEYEPIGSSCHQILTVSPDDNHQCQLTGFRNSPFKWIVHIFAVLLCGIPYMLASWYPKLKTFQYRKCSLEEATTILILDDHGNQDLLKVHTENVKLPRSGFTRLRYFSYHHTKFVWLPNETQFGSLETLLPPVTVDELLDDPHGLYDVDFIDMLKFYGPNKIEIEIKSYWELFVEEIFNPFYIFQIFSITLWCFDHYYIYSACIVLLTTLSVVTALRETRKQSEALHDMVESAKCHGVQVFRRSYVSENSIYEVDPTELVPGDLIILPKSDFILPCDIVLLNGQCIVNESMLTGECVPVTKVALVSADEIYTPSTHKKSTLFSGTHLIQSRFYGGDHVLGRVVKTGFDTTKGALIKSILFPTPVGLKFYKDSFKFVFVLFLVAATGMGYCIYLYTRRKASIKETAIRSLDIVTIVVPPALPAAMTVGIISSQNRLKKLGIYCISPPRINVCGKINLACFDKTGTLTGDGLNVLFVVPCNDTIEFTEPITDPRNLEVHQTLLHIMATCHSLTRIDGKLTGDPLDMSMFEFTNWRLEEPGEDETARYDMLAPTVVVPDIFPNSDVDVDNNKIPTQIGILRQFPFSSTLQCMTVVSLELGSKHMKVHTKGAPEKLASLCSKESLPKDFAERLHQYAIMGYRVIAFAHKTLPASVKWKDVQRMKREIVECDLVFAGLLVLQNPLKEETTPVIRTLHNAKIRSVMITGDNILTAISVARDCEMIHPNDQVFILEITTTNSECPNATPEITLQSVAPSRASGNVAINLDSSHVHFAIDGKTWNKLRTYYADLLPSLLVRTTVFARFQPDQKTQLITNFQQLDYVVSMVGDGANDCGALKAAHVGVSLSQAEASVAAPFTSSISNISCLVHLMLEGRCALVSSFGSFKFMSLYSLIQFFSVIILYKLHSILGDTQFLYVDLVVTTVLALTMGQQNPSTKLCPKRPLGSLVSLANIIPLILQVFLCGSIQILAVYYLYLQKDWFHPVPDDENDEMTQCWENTVVFLVSCFQYTILACVYSKGKPYRQRLLSNIWFIVTALALTIFNLYLMIDPHKSVADFFELMYLPRKAHDQIQFKYSLLAFPIVHLLLAIFIEVYIADTLWLKKLIRWLKRKKFPKSKYKLLLKNDQAHQYLFQRSTISRIGDS